MAPPSGPTLFANAGGVPAANPDSATNPEPGKLFGTEDADNLFGLRGGYIHPSLLFQEEWTDNLYNIRLQQQSNFLTIISPGFWLGFPRMEEIPIHFTPNNAAIGGNRFLLTDSESFERLQMYLSGMMEYKTYSSNSDLDTTAWQTEGLVRYNMPSGLSMHVLDRYSSDRDRFDRGSFALQESTTGQPVLPDPLTPTFIWDYTANLLNAAVSYTTDDRYAALIDYTSFRLVYDDEDSAWLSRTDNNLKLGVTYHYSPKTSFLAEYARATVNYDERVDNDSENSFYYGGVEWKGTSRIQLSAKAGYQSKSFDNITLNSDAFSMEAIFDYLVSDKTKISLTAYRALEETNSFADHGMETTAASLRYEQRYSYRLRGSCELHYALSDHSEFTATPESGTEARKDTTFSIRPAVEYVFRDWLTAELAYSYTKRDSTDNQFDYATQTATLGLNFAL